MTDEPTTLYAKLLGETAEIGWTQLQPFFARGALLSVEEGLDLIEVAQAVALDDHLRFAAWLTEGRVGKVSQDSALDYVQRDPELWAVVVSPWVLIQERSVC